MLKYSVITPVFNREDCIERCLESVTRNIGDRYDVEHIVVNDGSSDKTQTKVEKYAEGHPHVCCISFTKNRGTNAARNAAVASAKGKFCIILDSDDYWVESALRTIDSVVDAYPKIHHFCFAPDDMLQVYDANPMLSGKLSSTLTFEDFLLGRVSGDFVHVICTDIIKKHPFDEQLRIYEGVFFLEFYKDAKKILFVNKVVSHRERGRSDSVTREVIRINKATILRTIKAKKILVDRYVADYKKSDEGEVCLFKHKLSLLDNYLLLCDYKKAKDVIRDVEKCKCFVVPFFLKWVYYTRSGWFYYFLLKLYLRIKYNVLHTNVK